jgi:hypothetical protein
VKLRVLHGPVDVWTSIHFAVPVEEELLVFLPEVAVIEGW